MPGLFDKLAHAAIRATAPLNVTIELLTTCNLQCRHCYVTPASQQLTSAVLIELLDELARSGCLFVSFTGGEIGLRSDLFELIAAARARYLAVTLLSSGTLWSERDWDRIADLAVQSVRLSLYATNPAVHDEVTGDPGSHEKTVATLRGLRDRGVDVGLACPILSMNVSEVVAVNELATKLGISVTFDPNLTLDDEGRRGPKELLVGPTELAEMYGHNSMQDLELPTVAVPDPGNRVCRVGDSLGFVRADGDVFPCLNWPVAAGNIHDTPWRDIWRDSPVFKQARSLRHRNLTHCQSCPDLGVCTPCPGMNLHENGDVVIPSTTVCATTRALAEAVDSRIRGQRS